MSYELLAGTCVVLLALLAWCVADHWSATREAFRRGLRRGVWAAATLNEKMLAEAGAGLLDRRPLKWFLTVGRLYSLLRGGGSAATIIFDGDAVQCWRNGAYERVNLPADLDPRDLMEAVHQLSTAMGVGPIERFPFEPPVAVAGHGDRQLDDS